MIADHQVAFFLRELRAEAPECRAAAVKGLGRVPGRTAELAALAADPDPGVRAAVALGLGRQGGTAQVALLVSLTDDPDAEVRRRAVNALIRLGATGPAVTESLVRRVGDAELRSRPAVLEWLGRNRVEVPPEQLVPLLSHRDSMVWSGACHLMWLTPGGDAVCADLVRTATGQTRRLALRRLRYTQPAAAFGATPEDREEVWRRFLDPEPRTVRALLAALEAETEASARNVLLKALAVRRVPEAVAPAAVWLADSECGGAAAEVLGGAGTAEAVAALRRAVVDRRAHGAALGAAGGVAEAELLFALLDEPSEDVRLAVVDGLGAFFRRTDGEMTVRLERWRAERFPDLPPPPSADDPALRALARRTAARLAAMLAHDAEHASTYGNVLRHVPEARPLLPALLRHHDGRVRVVALRLTEHFDGLTFAERLAFLDDPHLHVRQEAAYTFWSLARDGRLTPDERRRLRSHFAGREGDIDRYVRHFLAPLMAVSGQEDGEEPE